MTKEYSSQEIKQYCDDFVNGMSIRKMADKYHKSRNTLSAILRQNGVNTNRPNRKYSLNEDYFCDIDNERKAYWLGFLAADGGISRTGSNKNYNVLAINLNERDTTHLEKFLQDIGSTAIIRKVPGAGYGEGTTIASVSINSQQFVRNLIKNGVVPNKSLILMPPTLPQDLQRHWIRGYLDGDGSISLLSCGEAQISFTGTKEVLTFIKNILTPNKDKKLGKRYKDDKNTYSLSYGGTTSIVNILNFLYHDSSIFLSRKYDKVIEIYSRFEK